MTPQRIITSKAELVAVLDIDLSEEQWQREVLAYAHKHGWLCAHFRPAQTAKGYRTAMSGDVGMPDCVFARDGVVVFAELKRVHGEYLVTSYQRRWLDETKGYLWTPKQRTQMQQVLA